MIRSGITTTATTATTNSRPKGASLHLALGRHWSTRLFLAQCKARRSGPASCIGQPNGRSLGQVEPTSVKKREPRPVASVPPARPGHTTEEEKGCKTVCRHRLPLHDYYRPLLPSHLGRTQAGNHHCLGS